MTQILTDISGEVDGVLLKPVDDTFEGTGDLDIQTISDLYYLDQETIRCQESLFAYEALMAHSADKTSLSLFYKRSLISQSSYLALEAVTDPISLTQAALEAVVEQAAESTKSWAGRAIATVGDFVGKCGTRISQTLTQVSDKVKASGTKIKDGVKAHPYATVAAVIAAITATAAAVVLARGCLSPGQLKDAASVSTSGEKVAAAFSRIKTNFSKADVVFKDGKLIGSVKDTAKATTEGASEGGWKFTTLKAAQAGFARALTSLWDALKAFGSTLASSLQAIWKFIKPHLKAGAGKVDSVVAGTINQGDKIANSPKHNFIVRMGAGILVFTFIKTLCTLVINTAHWIINLARTIVAKTVVAICGEDPNKDDENEDDLLK